MLSKDFCDNFKNKSRCFGVLLIVIMYFLKNADIIFVFSNIFFDFLVDNNLINMCAKYNVYIMFLTLILIGGAPGAPPPPPPVIILSQIARYR